MIPKAEFQELCQNTDKEAVCHYIHNITGELLVENNDISMLTQGKLTAYCVEVFFGLTCNGGYQSVFSGSYQWVVPHLTDALKDVGLDDYAVTFGNAVAKLFPNGVPEDEDDYDDLVEDLYDDFEESDLADEYEDPFEVHESGFWKLYKRNEEEFRDKLHHYIVSHPNQFAE